MIDMRLAGLLHCSSKPPFSGGFVTGNAMEPHNPIAIDAGKQGRAGAHRTGAARGDAGGDRRSARRKRQGRRPCHRIAAPQRLARTGDLGRVSAYTAGAGTGRPRRQQSSRARQPHRRSLLHRLRHRRRPLRADDTAPQRDLCRNAGATARARSRRVARPDRQSCPTTSFSASSRSMCSATR